LLAWGSKPNHVSQYRITLHETILLSAFIANYKDRSDGAHYGELLAYEMRGGAMTKEHKLRFLDLLMIIEYISLLNE
jgi:hypothetical protein